MKLRKWDNVILISGGRQTKTVDGEAVARTSAKGKTLGMKGKTWTILKVFKEDNKVLIEGVNIVKRHMKKQGTQPGQIIEMEKPVPASNVMLVCPYTGKPTRIGFFFEEDKKTGSKKKFRFSKIAVKEGAKKTPADAIIK